MDEHLFLLGMNLDHCQKLVDSRLRNIKILENQKTKMGMHCPGYVQRQLEDEKQEILKIVGGVRRYQYKLKENEAKCGINTAPEVLMEIEDCEKWLTKNRLS